MIDFRINLAGYKNERQAFLFLSLGCVTAESESTTQPGGFYAGVLGGITNLNTKYDLSYPAGPSSASYEAGKAFLSGGGFVGYHFPLENFYFETELYALYQNTGIWAVKDGNPGWNAFSVSLKKNYAYGAAALVGVPLFDSLSQTSAYVRLGIENGAYRLSILKTTQPGWTYTSATKNKNAISFAPGIGLKTFLMENLFLRADYTYVHTPSLKAYSLDGIGGTPLIHKFSPREQRFMVSVAYQF